MNYSILKNHGIDYEKGISRCLNDKDFYSKILALFLEDDAFPRAKSAFESKDYKELFSCLHELKGVSGNAELSELYEAVCPLVELLRNDSKAEQDIAALFKKTEKAYIRTREGIFLAFNE